MTTKRSKLIALISALLIVSLIASCDAGTTEDEPSVNRQEIECLHEKLYVADVKDATCTEEGVKELRCSDCGSVVSENSVSKKSHDYALDKTQCVSATCYSEGVKVSVCVNCGDVKEVVVSALTHKYSDVIRADMLREYNSEDQYIEFYKSCKGCGESTSETFKAELEELEKYSATSPTVTMYETAGTLSYGFTWLLDAQPFDVGIMITENDGDDWTYYPAEVEKTQTWLDYASAEIYVYVCKAVIELEPSTEYTYKFIENILKIESEDVTFTSVDPDVTSFTFASFSDSQNNAEDGSLWTKVLEKVSDVDFYIHSGDVCQSPQLEPSWTNMVNSNRKYLMQKPLMAISGNHETVYQRCDNVIYRHFNNNIPTQSTTNTGYFYSFTYGNAKFIMLNTNKLAGTKLTQEQYNWLISELQSNTATWTVVVMHNPLYSIGKYGSHSTYNSICMSLRAQLSDIFAEYGVDIVIQGHDHAYSKTYPIAEGVTAAKPEQTVIDGITYDVNPEGTIYIMNGPTGDQTRGEAGDVEYDLYEKYATSNAQSWAEYTVTEDSLTVTVKYLENGVAKTWYTWGIIKN